MEGLDYTFFSAGEKMGMLHLIILLFNQLTFQDGNVVNESKQNVPSFSILSYRKSFFHDLIFIAFF